MHRQLAEGPFDFRPKPVSQLQTRSPKQLSTQISLAPLLVYHHACDCIDGINVLMTKIAHRWQV